MAVGLDDLFFPGWGFSELAGGTRWEERGREGGKEKGREGGEKERRGGGRREDILFEWQQHLDQQLKILQDHALVLSLSLSR